MRSWAANLTNLGFGDLITMKKKLLIAIIVLGLLGIIGIGALVANVDRIVQALKPKIEEAASSALGAEVSLGKLSASVVPSTKLKVDQVKIVRPGEKDGFTLSDLTVQVRLMPLLGGKLDLISLSLDKPSITLILDQDGVSIQGLPRSAKSANATKENAHSADASSSKSAPASPVPAWLALNLEKFSISNGEVLVKDAPNKKQYELSELDIDATGNFKNNIVGISSLDLTGSLFAKHPMTVQGSDIKLNLGTQALEIGSLLAKLLGNPILISGKIDPVNGGKLNVSSPTGIDLATFEPVVGEVAPALKAFDVKGKVMPNLDTEVKGNKYDANGSIELSDIAATLPSLVVSALKGTLKVKADNQSKVLSSDNLTLSAGGEPVNARILVSLTDNLVELKELVANLFSGKATITANSNIASKTFDTKISAEDIKITKALTALQKTSIPVDGTLTKLSAAISGSASSNALQSLSGPITLEVKDGNIQGLNLAGDVLKAVKGLPFMSGSLFSSLPPEKQAALDANGTKIKILNLDANISDGEIHARSLTMDSEIFSLSASGTIGIDSSVKLKASIIFDKDFSDAFVKRTKELGNLLNDDGRMVIPLAIEGIAPKVMVIPDVGKLAELGAKNLLKNKGQDLLNNLLGGKKSGSTGKGFGGFGF